MASQKENDFKEEKQQAAVASSDAKLPLPEQRRSERKRKLREPLFSPDDFTTKTKAVSSTEASSVAKKRGTVQHRYRAVSGADRPFDILPNGQPFSCDLCQSPFVCNPLLSKRGSRGKRSRHMPSPRQKLNPATGKLLTLCNACCQSMEGPRPAKQVVPVSREDKEAYITEAKTFANDLADRLQDPEGQKLYCPNYKKKPCRCMQKYISADGNPDQGLEKARSLLTLFKQARQLATEKVYNREELMKKFSSKRHTRYKSIGLGNGQKRSQRFEAFILEHRTRLKNDLHLCERAIQRILCYSNNFLHKKLKTEERGSRVVRQKGKAALGLLVSLEDIGRRYCCVDHCVRMAHTHRNLLSQWRKRAISSQREARRVLAEMLTPSGGVRCNCYKFIGWVTGSSYSTIGKVRDQMRRTKGDREPPQHGLYSYWEHKTRTSKQRRNPSATVTGDADNRGMVSGSLTHPDSVQSDSSSSFISVIGGAYSVPADLDGAGMDIQRQQLLQLQDQVLQQQASITQQQQVVQQQIAALNSMQQLNWSHTASNAANVQQQVSQQMTQLHTAQQHLATIIRNLQQQLSSLQPAQQHHLPAVMNASMPDAATLPASFSTAVPAPVKGAPPAPLGTAAPGPLSAAVPTPVNSALIAPVNAVHPVQLRSALPPAPPTVHTATLPGHVTSQQSMDVLGSQLSVLPMNGQQLAAAPLGVASFIAHPSVSNQLPASFTSQVLQAQQQNQQHLPVQYPQASTNSQPSSFTAQQSSVIAQHVSASCSAQVAGVQLSCAPGVQLSGAPCVQLPVASGDQPQQVTALTGSGSLQESSQQAFGVAPPSLSFHQQASQQSHIGVVAFTQNHLQQQQQTCFSSGTYDFGQHQMAVRQPLYHDQQQQQRQLQQQIHLQQAPQQPMQLSHVQDPQERPVVQSAWMDASSQPPPYFSSQPLQPEGAVQYNNNNNSNNSVVHLQHNQDTQQKSVCDQQQQQQQNGLVQQWTVQQQQQQQTVAVGQPLQQTQNPPPVMLTLVQQPHQQQSVQLNQVPVQHHQHHHHHDPHNQQQHYHVQVSGPQRSSLPSQVLQQPGQPQLFGYVPRHHYQSLQLSLQQQDSLLDVDGQPQQEHQQLFRPPPYYTARSGNTQSLLSLPDLVQTVSLPLTHTEPPSAVGVGTLSNGIQGTQNVPPLSSTYIATDPAPHLGQGVVESLLLSEMPKFKVPQAGAVQLVTLDVQNADGPSQPVGNPHSVQLVQPHVNLSRQTGATQSQAAAELAGKEQRQVVFVCSTRTSSEVTQTQQSVFGRLTSNDVCQSSVSVSSVQQFPAMSLAPLSGQQCIQSVSKAVTVADLIASSAAHGSRIITHPVSSSGSSIRPPPPPPPPTSLILTLPRQVTLPQGRTQQPLVLTTPGVKAPTVILQQSMNFPPLLLYPQEMSDRIGAREESNDQRNDKVTAIPSVMKVAALTEPPQSIPSCLVSVPVPSAIVLSSVASKPIVSAAVCQTVASHTSAAAAPVVLQKLLLDATRQTDVSSVALHSVVPQAASSSSVVYQTVASTGTSQTVASTGTSFVSVSSVAPKTVSAVLAPQRVSTSATQQPVSIAAAKKWAVSPATVPPVRSSSVTGNNVTSSSFVSKAVSHIATPQLVASGVRPQTVVVSVLPQTMSSIVSQPTSSSVVKPQKVSSPTVPKKRQNPTHALGWKRAETNAFDLEGTRTSVFGPNTEDAVHRDCGIVSSKQLPVVTSSPAVLSSSVRMPVTGTVSIVPNAHRPILSASHPSSVTNITLPGALLLNDGRTILLTNSCVQASPSKQTVIVPGAADPASANPSSGLPTDVSALPVMVISSADPCGHVTSSAVTSVAARSSCSDAVANQIAASVSVTPSLRKPVTLFLPSSEGNSLDREVIMMEDGRQDLTHLHDKPAGAEVWSTPTLAEKSRHFSTSSCYQQVIELVQTGRKKKKRDTTKKQKQKPAKKQSIGRDKKGRFHKKDAPAKNESTAQTITRQPQYFADVTSKKDDPVCDSTITISSEAVSDDRVAHESALGTEGRTESHAPDIACTSLSSKTSTLSDGMEGVGVKSGQQIRMVEKLVAEPLKSGGPAAIPSDSYVPVGVAVGFSKSVCSKLPATSSAAAVHFSSTRLSQPFDKVRPSVSRPPHTSVMVTSSCPDPPMTISVNPSVTVKQSLPHSFVQTHVLPSINTSSLDSSGTGRLSAARPTGLATSRTAVGMMSSPSNSLQTLPSYSSLPRSQATPVVYQLASSSLLPVNRGGTSVVDTPVRFLPPPETESPVTLALSVSQVSNVDQCEKLVSSTLIPTSLSTVSSHTNHTESVQKVCHQNSLDTMSSPPVFISSQVASNSSSLSVQAAETKSPAFKAPPILRGVNQKMVWGQTNLGSVMPTHKKTSVFQNSSVGNPQTTSTDRHNIVASVQDQQIPSQTVIHSTQAGVMSSLQTDKQNPQSTHHTLSIRLTPSQPSQQVRPTPHQQASNLSQKPSHLIQRASHLRGQIQSSSSAYKLASSQPQSQTYPMSACTSSLSTKTTPVGVSVKMTPTESSILRANQKDHQTTPQTTNRDVSASADRVLRMSFAQNSEETVPFLTQPVTPLAAQAPSSSVKSTVGQSGLAQTTQASNCGFPVGLMPVGEGKKQMMCITSPMNFHQLKALLSHIQLPVGSVVKQISSSVKGKGSAAGISLPEITVPVPQLSNVTQEVERTTSSSHRVPIASPLACTTAPVKTSVSLTSTSSVCASPSTPATTERNTSASKPQTIVTDISDSQTSAPGWNVPTVIVDQPAVTSGNTHSIAVLSNSVKKVSHPKGTNSNSSRVFKSKGGQSGLAKQAVQARPREGNQHSMSAVSGTNQLLPGQGLESTVSKHSTATGSNTSLSPSNPYSQSKAASKPSAQTVLRRSGSGKASHPVVSTYVSPHSLPVPANHSPREQQQMLRREEPLNDFQTPVGLPCYGVDKSATSTQELSDPKLSPQRKERLMSEDLSKKFHSGENAVLTASSTVNNANAPEHAVNTDRSSSYQAIYSDGHWPHQSPSMKQHKRGSKSKRPKTKCVVSTKTSVRDILLEPTRRDTIPLSSLERQTLSPGSEVIHRKLDNVHNRVLSSHSTEVLCPVTHSAGLTSSFCSTTATTTTITISSSSSLSNKEEAGLPPPPPPSSSSSSSSSSPSSMVTLHTMSNVPYHFTCDTTGGSLSSSTTQPPGNVSMLLNPNTATSAGNDPHPFYSTTATFDRLHTASPAVFLPQAELDDANRDMEFMSGSGFFPFLSTSSRSRNSSGASSIEPSITIDPALLPFDLMQIMTQQGLALAVTEVVPPSSTEDSNG